VTAAAGVNASPSQRDVSDDAVEQALAFNRDVSTELHRMRVRRAAQDRLRAELEPSASPFDAGTLEDLLARPADPPMRVEGLVPSAASVLVVAQRKTGKTTLKLNLVRSLLTGEDFLGRFPVRPVEGVVTLLNYEVSAGMIARWAADVGVPQDRLFVVNLRGRRNPLSHPGDRARLAAELRERQTETLIVDPFGRAYTGSSQNDSGEVGAFLVDLDLFARGEVGAQDVVLSAHAGWNGERTRGSSALEDWADSIVYLTRDPDDESQRFLRAEGRDVDIDEDRLHYDPRTRILTMTGTGSRKQSKDTQRMAELGVLAVRATRDNPGIGVTDLTRTIREMDDAPSFRDGDVSKAAKTAAGRGFLRIESDGQGKKTRHYATDAGASGTTPANPCQTSARQDPPTPSTPSYREGVGGGGGDSAPTLAAVPSWNDSLPLEDGPPDDACADCGEPLPEQVISAGLNYHPTCQAVS